MEQVKESFWRNPMQPRFILSAVAALFVMTVFFMSYFTVEEYERGVVTTWGKVAYVADPGIGFKVPFAQSVTHVRNDIRSLQPQAKVNTYTADNQEIDILFTVFYRVSPAKVQFVYTNAQDYRERLFNIANDRLKAEMGKVKLEHFAEHRGEVRDRVKATMVQDALVLGVDVTDFQLTDVDYTKAFRDAVEKASVQKAGVETKEWERQQAEKIAVTKQVTALGDANAAREKARGDADARLLVAQAEAKAIKLEGEAKAEAMKAQANAITANPDLIRMKIAEQWNGELPTWMQSGANGALPLLNIGMPNHAGIKADRKAEQ